MSKYRNVLQEMLDIQLDFQNKYKYNPPIHSRASAIMAEAGELWAISGGKWWKKYIQDAESWGHLQTVEAIDQYLETLENQNKDKIVEESIDVWHFLLTVWNRLGLSAEDVYKEYTKKMGVNHDRQDTNY